MKHIHIQLPTNNPAYVKYRILDPIRHCKEQLLTENIKITVNENINEKADVLILHGMLDPIYLKYVEHLSNQFPIVWSCDDAMYNVPTTNPIHRHVGYTETEVMKHCLQNLAAAILTPTQTCANYYGHPQKTYVTPNLVDYREYHRFQPRSQTKRYGWISGNSHWADGSLIEHLPAPYRDKEFIFFSTLPESLTQYRREPGSPHVNIQPTLKNVGYLATHPLKVYQKVLNNLELDCGLAPLHDTIFNNCKSNLKWLEYSAMGIPCLASNVTPYKECIQHGINGYLINNTPDDWVQAIQETQISVGRNAHFDVLHNWSWQSEARNTWLNFFRSIVQ